MVLFITSGDFVVAASCVETTSALSCSHEYHLFGTNDHTAASFKLAILLLMFLLNVSNFSSSVEDPVFLPPANEVCEGYVLPGACLSTGGEYLGRYTPRQEHPPWQAHTHRSQCMLGYSQQAGGTHPTGIHSCEDCRACNRQRWGCQHVILVNFLLISAVADPGFPQGGVCQHVILPKFPKNCMNLKEFGLLGGRPKFYYVDRPLICMFDPPICQ